MKTIENEIFNKYQTDIDEVPIIFIIASPRTGSTLFYQLMIKLFNLSYFSNFIDLNMSQTPVIGTLIESSLNQDQSEKITLESHYGETKNIHEPSEASRVLKNWFEWSHPSEINGKKLKDGRREHFEKTISTMYALTKKPIVIKNAWNGYRIEELSKILKNSYFIWLRRDIIHSSHSDLIARSRKGDPSIVWSSATPHNYKKIQSLYPAHQQVVEAQYIYNTKVFEQLNKYVKKENFTEIWYENLENNAKQLFYTLLEKINFALGTKLEIKQNDIDNLDIECSRPKQLDENYHLIKNYAKEKYVDFINYGD